MDADTEQLSVEQRGGAASPAAPDAATRAVQPASRRGVAVVWIAAVAGLTLFLTLGTASVQVSSRVRFRRSLSVADVWSRFVDELADGGSAALVRICLWGAVALLLVGAALGLWLAMTADDGGPRRA